MRRKLGGMSGSRLLQTGVRSSSSVIVFRAINANEMIIRSTREEILRTYLTLHIRNLAHRKTELVQRHFRLLQIPQKSQLTLQQKQQTLPHFPRPRRPPNPMDIISRVVWGVELYYPVYTGDVESSGCHVCAEKDT